MEKEKALTILNDALQKVKNIPDSQWINRKFTDNKGACCVIGHYTRLTSGNPKNYSDNNCSDKQVTWGEEIGMRFHLPEDRMLRQAAIAVDIDIAEINNGKDRNFQQPTTKERAIAGLEESIKRWVCKEQET